MKKIVVILFIPLFFSGNLLAQNPKPVLKTDLDTVSYCMGMAIGSSLKMGGFKLFNEKLFMQAIQEVLSDKETLINHDQVDPIIRSYFMKLQGQKSSENLVTGKKFLEENKKKEGVVVLASGLQYKINKDGQGEPPTINDKVTVHYNGTLINGKVFDSSIQRGQPAQFQVNGVIKGWSEALLLMKPGSKWTLFIPPDLAYGDQNIPGIEPNSVLIFEVELISVDKDNISNQ